MYIVEAGGSPRKILVYDVADGATLTNKRTFLEAGRGHARRLPRRRRQPLVRLGDE
jgi:hypothetical protein